MPPKQSKLWFVTHQPSTNMMFTMFVLVISSNICLQLYGFVWKWFAPQSNGFSLSLSQFQQPFWGISNFHTYPCSCRLHTSFFNVSMSQSWCPAAALTFSWNLHHGQLHQRVICRYRTDINWPDARKCVQVQVDIPFSEFLLVKNNTRPLAVDTSISPFLKTTSWTQTCFQIYNDFL